MDIEPNVGETDRYLRVGAGVVFLIFGILGYAGVLQTAVGPVPQALASLVLVLVGAILAVTGLMRTCPIYMGLGLNTLRR